ncbi:uncharacterized protein LOC111242767 [Vigna radiata var. radiata]|uniref:Uncharacterized protein LOC111242767 n=1 Tax=Vigna radiata var. radiata TaxID=3916 RepID=A0A3Q0FM08_VIGRR|nr:uncharacterized protein LOC111242767 [Vigna radiata var. radiata]
MSFWFYFGCKFDGDTCKENEFRAFAGRGGARCVVGMVILAKDKSHDVGFLRVMEFRDGGLSWCRSRARFHGGDVRELGFMVATRLGFSAMRFGSSEIVIFSGFCCV